MTHVSPERYERHTYFTEREKSPGALSLSLMRKAPSCLCLFSISSALARGIFPKNHLEGGSRGNAAVRSTLKHFLSHFELKNDALVVSWESIVAAKLHWSVFLHRILLKKWEQINRHVE